MLKHLKSKGTYVTRLWETLQSRLPVEFGVAGIKTIEEANIFLNEFIKEYNQKFAVEPKEAESAFRQLDGEINLRLLFCGLKKQGRLIMALRSPWIKPTIK